MCQQMMWMEHKLTIKQLKKIKNVNYKSYFI